MAEGYTVACYYFPNYHVDARNEAQHGPGWTEWELVRRAEPRFEGHRQPRVPLWGYEDEADPEVMARKIAAAADHGIDVFLFDWYYYDDGPFLERGLEEGFFNASNNSRMRFAVMWANHDWIDIHPAKRNVRPTLLYPGKVTPKTFERMTSYIVDTYFSHPCHWTIEGCPYFSVYDLSKLIASFDGIKGTRQALDQFRAKTEEAGFPGLHLNAVVWGETILPGEEKVKDTAGLVRDLGFDSVASYVWIHHVPLRHFPETLYEQVMDAYFEYAADAQDQFGVPYYPNVSTGWDASPRACQSDILDNTGYPSMASISGNTPKAFKDALRRAKNLLDARSDGQRILTINAWNEWTEGSYLEPDMMHGMGYLEGIRDVFGVSRPSPVYEA